MWPLDHFVFLSIPKEQYSWWSYLNREEDIGTIWIDVYSYIYSFQNIFGNMFYLSLVTAETFENTNYIRFQYGRLCVSVWSWGEQRRRGSRLQQSPPLQGEDVPPDYSFECFRFAHNPQNDSGASTPDTVKPREVESKFLAFTWAVRWISFALKLPPNVSSSFLCKRAVAIYSKLPLSPLPCHKCTSRNTSLTLVLFTSSSILHTFRS